MLLEIKIIVTVSYLIIFGAFATVTQMHQEMLARRVRHQVACPAPVGNITLTSGIIRDFFGFLGK